MVERAKRHHRRRLQLIAALRDCIQVVDRGAERLHGGEDRRQTRVKTLPVPI